MQSHKHFIGTAVISIVDDLQSRRCVIEWTLSRTVAPAENNSSPLLPTIWTPVQTGYHSNDKPTNIQLSPAIHPELFVLRGMSVNLQLCASQIIYHVLLE